MHDNQNYKQCHSSEMKSVKGIGTVVVQIQASKYSLNANVIQNIIL